MRSILLHIAAGAALFWAASPSVAQAPRSNQWLADCKGESRSACGVSMLVDAGRSRTDLFLISVAVDSGVISVYSPVRAEVAQLRVDDNPTFDVGPCQHGNCTLPAGPSGALLAEMRQGGHLTIEFKPHDGQVPLPFVVSLDGFAARYGESQAHQASR